MSSAPLDPLEQFEASIAASVRVWTDQAIVPIDAAAIAREVLGPGGHPHPWPRGIRTKVRTLGARVAATITVVVLVATAILVVDARPAQVPGVSVTEAPPTPAAAAATEFRGRAELSGCAMVSPTVVAGEVPGQAKSCSLTVTQTTDRRFRGDGAVHLDRVHPSGLGIVTAAFVIANEEGAWRQDGLLTLSEADGRSATATVTLVGEGGYADQTVVVQVESTGDVWELRGVLIDSKAPPAPHRVPPSPEFLRQLRETSPEPSVDARLPAQARPSSATGSGGA